MENVRSLLAAMEQRSQNDSAMLEKQIKASEKATIARCEVVEKHFDEKLELEKKHFAELYGSHAIATREICHDMELRQQESHSNFKDEVCEIQKKTDEAWQKKFSDFEQLCFENAEALATTQQQELQQMRKSLEQAFGWIENNLWWYIVDTLKKLFDRKGYIEDAACLKDLMTECFVKRAPKAIEDAPRPAVKGKGKGCQHREYRGRTYTDKPYGREQSRRERSRSRYQKRRKSERSPSRRRRR